MNKLTTYNHMKYEMLHLMSINELLSAFSLAEVLPNQQICIFTIRRLIVTVFL